MEKILKKLRKFRDDRDWKKYHNPKDLALSISIEAAELLEHFQWKDAAQVREHVRAHKEEVADEIADVAAYLFELADELGIDLLDAMDRKIDKNARKYPVEKAKGTAAKYDRL